MRYTVLATDYDGTIAEQGTVLPSTVAALRRFRESGGQLILVTGREVQDLQSIFPELALFHWVVAENGALLFETSSATETLLAGPPSPTFLQALRRKNVAPLYIGQVIVATYDHQLLAIEETISELDLDLQVIPNKGAVMILPKDCDKASGLRLLFEKAGIISQNTVGVGDAENDIPLLAACGLGVALANALPSLKAAAGWVMSKPAGAGVAELIDRLLAPHPPQSPPLEDMPKYPIKTGR